MQHRFPASVRLSLRPFVSYWWSLSAFDWLRVQCNDRKSEDIRVWTYCHLMGITVWLYHRMWKCGHVDAALALVSLNPRRFFYTYGKCSLLDVKISAHRGAQTRSCNQHESSFHSVPVMVSSQRNKTETKQFWNSFLNCFVSVSFRCAGSFKLLSSICCRYFYRK